MLEFLDPYDVEMVALSPDTMKESGRTKRWNKLNMPILSDEDLAVIDLRCGARSARGKG